MISAWRWHCGDARLRPADGFPSGVVHQSAALFILKMDAATVAWLRTELLEIGVAALEIQACRPLDSLARVG